MRHLIPVLWCKDKCFNPRTHMGCDVVQIRQFIRRHVSIHSPTWDATKRFIRGRYRKAFQSTHPHGMRRCGYGLFHEDGSVSIHAPTWDATQAHLLILSAKTFQSTHPHGMRPNSAKIRDLFCRFNPRTHMGCDSIFFSRSSILPCFNPRTHMGCDTKGSMFPG